MSCLTTLGITKMYSRQWFDLTLCNHVKPMYAVWYHGHPIGVPQYLEGAGQESISLSIISSLS